MVKYPFIYCAILQRALPLTAKFTMTPTKTTEIIGFSVVCRLDFLPFNPVFSGQTSLLSLHPIPPLLSSIGSETYALCL